MSPPRLQPMDLVIGRLHPRSKTVEILQSLGMEVPSPDEALTPPEPEDDATQYTKERLGQGLVFVEARLRRNISPRSAKVLELQQASIVAALEDTDSEKDEFLLGQIRIMDDLIYNNNFIRSDPYDQQLQNTLLELKELVFYCRYGDYVRDKLALLRYRSKTENTRGHEHISGKHLWSAISAELKDEKDRHQEALKAGKETDRPLTMAVWIACSELGFDKNLMVDAIDMYGKRNNAVHADIEKVIKLCKWSALARILCQDLIDLPLLIPPSRPQDLMMVGSIIEDLRDTYFEPKSGDADDPDTWVPSAKARELSQKRQLEKEEEEETAKQRAAKEAINLRNRQAKADKVGRKQASMELVTEQAKQHQQFARELAISFPAEYQEFQRQIKPSYGI